MLLQTDRAAYVGNDVAKGTTTVTEVALDLHAAFPKTE
jgi:hypothetical protein